MRIISLFLVSLLFLPVIASAQDHEFDQKILVLATENASFYPRETVATNCDWATPFLTRELGGGVNYDLRAISVNRKTGAFIKNRYQVGSMQACWSVAGDEIEDPVFGTDRMLDIAYIVEVNGETYGGLGTVKTAGFSDAVPGSGIYSESVILVEIVDGQPGAAVGAMTINVLQNDTGIEAYGDPLSGIATIRLFGPKDEGTETLADVLGIGS
jgi:hypothetical protein